MIYSPLCRDAIPPIGWDNKSERMIPMKMRFILEF